MLVFIIHHYLSQKEHWFKSMTYKVSLVLFVLMKVLEVHLQKKNITFHYLRAHNPTPPRSILVT